MKLAIVGSTGLVGKEILRVLQERKFPYKELILVASKKSKGKAITVNNRKHKVICIEELIEKKPNIALFSAGSTISKEWAPKLAELGCKVIDNSSCWRMCSKHKLIVPEINGQEITKDDLIIANPNCSVIQLLVVLAPLHKSFGVNRVVVSTYQSVTGTGKKAVDQLNNEEQGLSGEMIYPHPIYRNALPHIDVFENNGYTKEEMKIINETHKILDPNICITSTAVRVPIEGGHCESVNISMEKDFSLNEVVKILKETPGIIVQDDIAKNTYPMPIKTKGLDEVFVGRIRNDFSQSKTINLWIVADNLRKGAATNTVQIAEYMLDQKFI